jgi:hypothetical protein
MLPWGKEEELGAVGQLSWHDLSGKQKKEEE